MFVVVIAGLVTVVDMVLNAWMHDLYKVLGLFIALIVVNCAILGRAEAFAVKNGVLISAVDGLAMGLALPAPDGDRGWCVSSLAPARCSAMPLACLGRLCLPE